MNRYQAIRSIRTVSGVHYAAGDMIPDEEEGRLYHRLGHATRLAESDTADGEAPEGTLGDEDRSDDGDPADDVNTDPDGDPAADETETTS